MNIRLSISDFSKLSIKLPSDEDEESLESVLIYLCSSLMERLDFNVGGFGQDAWPISVNTDVADLISQLVNVLENLKKNLYFEIIFSEQSLSRKLEFYPEKSDKYKITCSSWGSWVADSTYEVLGRPELYNIFYGIFMVFIDGIKIISPQSLENYWIRDWIEKVDQIANMKFNESDFLK